ncbi:AAA family ATPase [Lacticaseibacillus baoqingensis]|uniref:AAA family ATPase n=1 Tax=Lacticaseibacillus baoqingensis TaxID=2486013 RepID=A0ABW4E3C5_9LACO|nr:AAA family ATPase [Lacticaseibacillus baoqingensis]
MQMTPLLSGAGITAVTWCRASPLCHRDIDTIIRLKRTYSAVLVFLLPLAGGRLTPATQVKLFRSTFGDQSGVLGVPMQGAAATVAQIREGVLAQLGQYFTQAPTSLSFTPGPWPADTDLDAAAKTLLAQAQKRFGSTNCQLDRSVIMAHDQVRQQIEAQPLANWAQIAPQFRRHYKVNVALVGGASTGKTQLAQDLSNYYAVPVSDEYARAYQPARNVMDTELDGRDFRAILEGQYDRNRAVIEDPYAPGLFIADTETITSATYLKLMLAAEYTRLKPLIADLVARSQWTLLLVLPPQAPFVEDGYRGAAMGEANWRQTYYDTLQALLHQYYAPAQIVTLDALPNAAHHDLDGYYARFNQAVRYIDAAMATGGKTC